MRLTTLASFGIFWTSTVLSPAQGAEDAAPALAITHVAVVDATSSVPRPDRTVLVRDGRIVSVGGFDEVRIPAGTLVLNGNGKYLIPGLADMHVHYISSDQKSAAARAAAAVSMGITTVFSPAMMLKDFAVLKKLGNAARAPYPAFFSTVVAYRPAGEVSGNPPNRPASPDKARESVRYLHSQRVDGIKLIYDDASYASKTPLPVMKREVMGALIDEAHRLGIKAYVHAPILAMAKEALRAGADGLIHGIISDPIDDEFISLMKRNKAVYISTSTLFEAMADFRGYWTRAQQPWPQNPDADEITAMVQHVGGVRAPGFTFDKTDAIPKQLPVLRSNLVRVFRSGINVVTGSDMPFGVASLMEIQLHVEAGLKPGEALQAATINPQRMVGRDREVGTIEAGKVADMVLLDANPLEDIGNIRRINRIFRGGLPMLPAGHPAAIAPAFTPLFVDSADGTPIAIHRSGSGSPVLLIHGGATDGRTQWSRLERFLAPRFSVHIMDRRAHGLSGDAGSYSIAKEADDIIAAARTLGENVTIVAHSYGALCTLAALGRLQNVGRVILYEPPFYPGGPPPDKAALFRQLDQAMSIGNADQTLETGMAIVGMSDARIRAIKASPAWLDSQTMVARIGARELQTVRTWKLPDGRIKAGAPVFVLLGTQTGGYLKTSTTAACGAISGCVTVPLENQGHIANILAPELLASVISGLVTK